MNYLFLNINKKTINILFYKNNVLIKTINCLISKPNILEDIIIENNIKILGFKNKSILNKILNLNIKNDIIFKYFLLDDFFKKIINKEIDLENKDIIFCITLFNFIKLNFKQSITEILDLKDIYLDNKNIFLNKNILITGKIIGFTRGEIFQRIRILKGNLCSTYSDKVDILIKGTTRHRTSKLIAVERAISNGEAIKILNETELKEIIFNS